MILDAFETLLDRTPPAWLRKIETAALMGVFAKAFDVEAPGLEDLPADETLFAFREFTAACMEAALVDEEMAATYRARLGAEAHELGRKIRTSVPMRPSSMFRLVKFFYRGIGIDLSGELPGSLKFGACSFAQRYTTGDCQLMAAFDEGFMCGAMGVEGALRFKCRLTEGASCCCASFGTESEEPESPDSVQA